MAKINCINLFTIMYKNVMQLILRKCLTWQQAHCYTNLLIILVFNTSIYIYIESISRFLSYTELFYYTRKIRQKDQIADCFLFLNAHTVPSTLTPVVSLTPAFSTVDVGSSVMLNCTPSLSNANQYNGANVNFQYQLNGGNVFRNVNKTISGGIVPIDSIQMTTNTSSVGTYTCNVTVNGDGISTITGSSASGQDTAQITAQSKYHQCHQQCFESTYSSGYISL